MSDKKIYTVEDLIEKVSKYQSEESVLNKIREAYVFAERCHKGQFRKSGEEYIVHPLNVAIILMQILRRLWQH